MRKAIGICWSLSALLALAVTASVTTAGETIKVAKLASRPSLDGNAAEWGAVKGVTVPVRGKLAVKSVLVKGGVFGDEVYFLVQWADSTEDSEHRPFIWNAKLKKYDSGKESEDRLAIQFAMSGDYTADWFSGQSFTADMWHWKAARSNPAGLVHDKYTIISTEPQAKSFKTQAKNGKTIYIKRPSDDGDSLYKTARYAKKEKDRMPKYVLVKNPTGSIADVKARGSWKNGTWTLELSRKLDTGHKDDAVFRPGQAIKGAIAVFDRSGDDNHNVSDTLVFQF